MPLSHKRFHVLDSFRGIAALFVVLFHMHYMGAISESIFFRNSNLFVEFFFILSGFVLTHSYMLKKHLSFRNFFISRTFRLLPLHLFVLLLFIALEFGKLYAYKHGFHFNNVPFTAASNITDIVPNVLLLQSWLPNVSTVSWNYPSWSISVEYYLYMIFFLTLLLKVFNRYIVWILFVLVASLLIFNDFSIAEDVLRGFSCFFSGALLYVLYIYMHDKVTVNPPLYLSIVEVLLVVLVGIVMTLSLEHKSLIMSGLFLILIGVFAFEKGIISQWLKKDPFLYLGKLSYSIYMIHAFVLMIVYSLAMILQKLLGIQLVTMVKDIRTIDIGSPLYNNIAIVIVLLSIIFLSYFTYRYIEKRGQDVGKKWISNHR